MAVLVLVATVFLSLLGFVTLIAVAFFWPKVESVYPEWLAKPAISVIRVVQAGTPIAIALTKEVVPQGPAYSHWLSAQIVAICGYLFWEITGVISDQRTKKTVAKVEDLKEESISRIMLLAAIDSLLHLKRERLRERLNRDGAKRPTLESIQAGLSPRRQIQQVVEQIAIFFEKRAHRTREYRDRLDLNFRVGVYLEKDGVMQPVYGFDLQSKNRYPFKSHRICADRFQVANTTNPAHVVKCLSGPQLILVPECLQESGFHLHDGQKEYLRSFLAYRLFENEPGEPRRHAVLNIDTNIDGYFRKEDEASIKNILAAFARRLELEAWIFDTIHEGGDCHA